MNEPSTATLLDERPSGASATGRTVRGVPAPLEAPWAADPFLTPTRYMDVDHPSLVELRERLGSDARDERELAVRLFEHVRDEIRYAFGPWGVPASETLRRGTGTCSNKNTLLVALLRGAGIPAACGVLRVNALEYFGCLAPPYLKAFLKPSSARSTHIYAAAMLDGRWVRCDPTTDRELSEKTAHFCFQTGLVEWDGERDAMDFIEPEHIHADLGLMATIDHLLDKPARAAVPETLALGNDYLSFVRESRRFSSAEELTRAYAEHVGIVGLDSPPEGDAP